jgi:hypothetical protein
MRRRLRTLLTRLHLVRAAAQVKRETPETARSGEW